MPTRPHPMRFPALPRSFYLRDVHVVARWLLGKRLIRTTPEGRTSGRIVEVEAYRGADDTASHSHRGQTARNRSMFGEGGHAYVYTIHGQFCMNVVTQPAGIANGVLIRAIQPIEGFPLMARRRGREKLLEFARGPGRLCQAMAINRSDDGWDLTRRRRLWIADDRSPPVTQIGEQLVDDQGVDIAISPRIGVTSAQHLHWRYFVADCRFVSGSRRDHRL